MSTFFFPPLMSCSLMVGATSSEFHPFLSLGRLTVKCREHPELISSRSCAAASWLTTLLSTCITINNFCKRIIQIPASVLVCFGIFFRWQIFRRGSSELEYVTTLQRKTPSALAYSHYLPVTHSLFNADHLPSISIASYKKKFYVFYNFSYVWR